MAAIAELKALLKLNNAQYKAGMQDSTRATKGFQDQVATIGRSIAAAFSVVAIAQFARSVIKLGSDLSDLSKQAGLTTDEFQALEFSAIRAGAQPERLRQSFSKLSVALADAKDGGGEYLDMFKAIGVTQEQVMRMDTKGAFLEVARAMSTATDGSVQFGAALELIGARSGAQLREVLEDVNELGFDGLIESAKDAGQVIDEDLITKLDDVEDRLQLAGRQAKAFGAELLGAILFGPERIARLVAEIETAIETGRPVEDVIRAAQAAQIQDMRGPQKKSADASGSGPAPKLTSAEKRAIMNRMSPDEQAEKDIGLSQVGFEFLLEAEEGQKRKKSAGVRELFAERKERERERLASFAEGATGTGTTPDAMAKVGGFVGPGREGLGIADREMKVARETAETNKRIEKLEQEQARLLKEIAGNTQPSGVPI